MLIALVMPSSHLILWRPLLLLPSIFPSIRDFSNEFSVCIRWPKYWSFSFSISPSSEYSGSIAIKINWFDFFAVQGTFRSLVQHDSLKASILWHSAFFTAQLSQPYMTLNRLQYSANVTFLCSGKTENSSDSLYFDTYFIVGVWNWIYRVSKVCPY